MTQDPSQKQSNEHLRQRALHLAQVEKLTGRQILAALGMGYYRLKRLLAGDYPKNPMPTISSVEPYRRLLETWYAEYPRLKASQIYEKLKSYGYTGSYSSIRRFTQKYRRKQQKAYFALDFLPGEEAQVDWFYFKHPKVGQVAGFLYVLSHSRYAWGGFYPRTSFEFFLQAHVNVFEHLKGLARKHRYDNLKSVVIKRSPAIEYNGQFLDFARFYGFAVHVCNPYSGNEKGRVERLIRDIRVWLYGLDFEDLFDLNKKFHEWLGARNDRIHRSTQKTPLELLGVERLLGLPKAGYRIQRIVVASVSKTAFVQFDTNYYSTPSWCAARPCEILANTQTIQIHVGSKEVAAHKRCFGRGQTVKNPLHEKRLLEQSPHYKMIRIRRLIEEMDIASRAFVLVQETEEQRTQSAYEIFKLLITHGRVVVLSALRELHEIRTYKTTALRSLLELPSDRSVAPVWPRDIRLLNLQYEQRRLDAYDPNPRDLESS